MKSNFYTTFYLLLLISLGYIATDIYLPSLPAMAVYFQASENQVQMTLFSYLFSFSLTPLICGPLSDHVGRKKVILGGVIVSILASCASLFALNIYWLIGARFIQGIGTGAILIAARATVSDLYTGQALAKQMSFITMLMALMLSLAPTLGGWLQQGFGWQAVFIFLICYMILIFACAVGRSETLSSSSQHMISQVFSTYRSHLRNPLFRAYGFIFSLPSFGLFGYLTISPFLFQEKIGLSPVEYGTLALYVGLTIALTGYLNYQMLHRFSVIQMLTLGGGLVFLSGSLLLLFHMLDILTLWSLLIPTLIYVTCIPLCVANSASRALSLVKEHYGAASALLTTFQFLAGAFGSFLFSLIPDASTLPLALSFMAVGLLALLNLKYAAVLESNNAQHVRGA